MNNEQKRIVVLGSTGSVGVQALDVASCGNYAVDALAFGSNIQLGEEQIRKHKPYVVAVENESAAKVLRDAISDTNTKIFSGKNGVCEMIETLHSDICINAISGFAGLRPTLNAIDRFPRIGLANKETIVAAGDIVMRKAKEKNCTIIPVDSEHSAIFQCLQGEKHNEIKKILLTCSGGPFFGKTPKELKNITVEKALGHPTWKMGAKITVDCATLMNKGLEVIEAMHLFHVNVDKIEVVIHRESIIHSMVEYIDNAIIAQLGVSDMRLPIQYALTYPERITSPCESLDLKKIGKLSFYEPDRETFPLLALAEKTALKGGILPCVMNAANEEAVALFLNRKIGFTDIFSIVIDTVNHYDNIDNPTLEEIEAANQAVRLTIRKSI